MDPREKKKHKTVKIIIIFQPEAKKSLQQYQLFPV